SVLNHLGSFCNLDRTRFMGASSNDRAVELINYFGNFRCRARGNLEDIGNTVLLISRIDSFRAIATEKVLVKGQARDALKYWHTVFFCRARVNGRFVYDDITLLEYLAYGFAGFDQGGEIRLPVLIDWCWHCHDKDIAGFQIVQQIAVRKMLRL